MKILQYSLIAFLLIGLIQLLVPSIMIYQHEKVLNSGTTYKFKTAPLDPYDPFRGRYVSLDFEEDFVDVPNADELNEGEDAFAILEVNEEGFGVVKALQKEQPKEIENYVIAKIKYKVGENSTRVNIQLPFNKFYCEESKAPRIELKYNEFRRDSTKTIYAEVKVKSGNYSVTGLYVDGQSILDLLD